MINVISEDKVTEYDMPTRPMPPMRIHEPLNPHGTCVNKKVVGKVRIPAEKWESQRPTEFVVGPLTEHDAILGMPFLAEEGILIDPAQNKVILPAANAPPAHSGEEELEDGADLDDDLEQRLEGGIAEELTVGVDGKDVIHDDGVADLDGRVVTQLVEAEFPSICPKIKVIRKLVPPQHDLAWIKDFEEFYYPEKYTPELNITQRSNKRHQQRQDHHRTQLDAHSECQSLP